jgi:hypothetical protein
MADNFAQYGRSMGTGMGVMDALSTLMGKGQVPMMGNFGGSMPGYKQLGQAASLGKNLIGLQKAMKGDTPVAAAEYYNKPEKLAPLVISLWKEYRSDMQEQGLPPVDIMQFIAQGPFNENVKAMFSAILGDNYKNLAQASNYTQGPQ